MILTREQLNQLNSTNRFIIDWCDWFTDYEEDLIYTDERIEEVLSNNEEISELHYMFPGEFDWTVIEIDEFFKLSEDLKEIEIVNSGIIKTRFRRYYVVDANDPDASHLIRNVIDVKTELPNGTTVEIVNEPFIVGLAATRMNEYESDEWGAISPYIAIEIVYKNEEDILEEDKEKELVNSFIFEIADSFNIALDYSEIRNPIYDYEDIEEEAELVEDLRGLEEYNELSFNYLPK